MYTVEEIIEQARYLPLQEQRRLVTELAALLASKPEAEQLPKEPYARSLALAGSAHADCTDVSADKYKHLAVAYSNGDHTEQ